ncbi:unnamed protein product [Staurois parvus]|uniref:Uncharacterized protein n=1 Tax=Staurois parvus TaxID=386267 RepID=A0ABN9C9E1_9NEOB|nr:unnamed protein product [Staurois parvus]
MAQNTGQQGRGWEISRGVYKSQWGSIQWFSRAQDRGQQQRMGGQQGSV